MNQLDWAAVPAMVRYCRRALLGIAVMGLTAAVGGEETQQGDSPILVAPKSGQSPMKGQALIVAGLPGDEEHEKLFAEAVEQWRKWLTGPLGFAPAEVRVLFGRGGPQGLAQGAATREAVEKEAARLKQTLRPEDRLWVFFLGHANFDGEHARFHLPGPDLREDRLGKLFAGIRCRRQVFWLTGAESGRFLPPLSAKGRIVIAATRSKKEDNETEFPYALADVAQRRPQALDLTKDGKVSVLEIYYLVIAEVQNRYAADNRVPTEHAQLDDNGDLVGTERPLAVSKDNASPPPDGVLAFQTILPYPPPPPAAEKPSEPIFKDSVKK